MNPARALVATILWFGLTAGPPVKQSLGLPVVHVWKVGSPHKGNTPDADMPVRLYMAAQRLGFQLDMRVFAAKDFAEAFFDARTTNDEPDILVIDNMGHIKGITTPLGTFRGIGSDPNVAGVLVKASESLKAFQPTPWEYLIRTSKHYAEAKALATRPIECHSEWADSIDTMLSTTAQQAVGAYFQDDTATFAGLVNGAASDSAVHLPHEPRSISDVRVCDGWGNDRLAFLQVTVAFEASDEIGYRTFLAAVASTEGHPRVLMVGDSTTIVSVLQRGAPRLMDTGNAGAIQAPVVISPDDGVSATRMPAASRPTITWRAPGAALCLIESQFGQPWGGDWQGSGFAIARSTAPDDPRTFAMQAPFGVGHQPHRWRIWAISNRGEVARSEWRTILYTN